MSEIRKDVVEAMVAWRHGGPLTADEDERRKAYELINQATPEELIAAMKLLLERSTH